MSFEIACCLALKEPQVYHHLEPLARHPLVSKLWIVRTHPSRYGAITRAEYILTPSPIKPIRWLKMLRACEHLARRPNLRAFVSFNPFPYGLLAARAARRHGKAMHIGFIGTDWFRYMQGPLGDHLLRRIRHADFFTATGHAMRNDMIRRGLPPDRITILPHAIDLERYPVARPDAQPLAAVFVGNQIPLKRIDVLIHAFARVLEHRPNETFRIIGGGPLLERHRALAAALGIAHAVEFTGHVEPVAPLLAEAKIIVIASSQEGLPFALIEGICSGLVPIATPVGTIPDIIRDGENGRLVPVGDATALADAIRDLLEHPETLARLRRNALRLRDAFSYSHATDAWTPWLQTLEHATPTPHHHPS